jgi:hypothetical protein
LQPICPDVNTLIQNDRLPLASNHCQ